VGVCVVQDKDGPREALFQIMKSEVRPAPQLPELLCWCFGVCNESLDVNI
jgi:hypothetical protein